MVGVIVGCLLLGAGIAYGAGTLIVDYGSSVGVTGKVIIIAPDPTVNDIEVGCPEFTIVYGDTTPLTGKLAIYNGSGWPLTLTNATISMDNTDVGTITLEPILTGVNDTLLPGSIQEITITLTPWSKLVTTGTYSYSGSLEFNW